MNNISGDSAQSSIGLAQPEPLETSLRWQVATIIGIAVAYFMSGCLIIAAAAVSGLGPIALAPLMVYDVVKIVICSIKVSHCAEIDTREYAKDLLECSLTLLFKVRIRQCATRDRAEYC